ncbi:Uncharacterised protein [Amycolatopsis camponoti]|uniref:Uncharacterized protein n=1 Tax=Amycolatopsis camponoti TaxID=2606593 RepID=A0A6I8M8T8_9PSEU|nr:Uncharacterised protein [Amycolatopsis camponoti]
MVDADLPARSRLGRRSGAVGGGFFGPVRGSRHRRRPSFPRGLGEVPGSWSRGVSKRDTLPRRDPPPWDQLHTLVRGDDKLSSFRLMSVDNQPGFTYVKKRA